MEATLNELAPNEATPKDHWSEFRALRRRMDERWDQASQLERGVLVWEVSEAKQRALEFERRRSRADIGGNGALWLLTR